MSKMKLNRRELLAGTAATAAMAFGMGPLAAQEGGDIVLGGSIPLTGVFAFAGVGIHAGIQDYL